MCFILISLTLFTYYKLIRKCDKCHGFKEAIKQIFSLVYVTGYDLIKTLVMGIKLLIEVLNYTLPAKVIIQLATDQII